MLVNKHTPIPALETETKIHGIRIKVISKKRTCLTHHICLFTFVADDES